MKGLKQEDLENQDLITELRKEYGMIYSDFYMVLTDLDMKAKVKVMLHFQRFKALFFHSTFQGYVRCASAKPSPVCRQLE